MEKINYQVPIKGLLLILFEMGFALKMDIVGSISVSELFVFVYTIYFLWRDPMQEESAFRRLVLVYFALLGSQCLSELMVGNILANSLKGISVTIISFCHLYFLIRMFRGTRQFLPWAFVGMVLRPLIMQTDYQGDALLALNGQDNVYLKFVIAPLLINIMMLYSFFQDNRKTSVLLSILGILLMLLGARAWGALAFISGIMTYFIISGRVEKVRSLVVLIVTSLALVYGAYALYVSNVLNGNIESGNSSQLNRTDDPYNPINLLKVGRTEAFIGAIAFSDSPLWGHGAWKRDSDYGFKYTKMKSQYQHLNEQAYLDDIDIIPCHSILIGFGCYNGIFTFISGCLLIGAFVILGLYNIFILRHKIILSTYFLTILLWHSLFSPQSHLRLTLPLYMAFIYVTYFYKRQQINAYDYAMSDDTNADDEETESIDENGCGVNENEPSVTNKDYVAEYQKRHKPLI